MHIFIKKRRKCFIVLRAYIRHDSFHIFLIPPSLPLSLPSFLPPSFNVHLESTSVCQTWEYNDVQEAIPALTLMWLGHEWEPVEKQF